MTDQPFNSPRILGPNGRPAVGPAPASSVCPRCGAGRDRRILGGGFGTVTPMVLCGACGHHFEGETEP